MGHDAESQRRFSPLYTCCIKSSVVYNVFFMFESHFGGVSRESEGVQLSVRKVLQVLLFPQDGLLDGGFRPFACAEEEMIFPQNGLLDGGFRPFAWAEEEGRFSEVFIIIRFRFLFRKRTIRPNGEHMLVI